ncbi:tyrosine-type recombinase/integrase [Burkholderia cenocepacia]|uniref:tyrosine-type recombinase/integrase n=1 Tax=Burkholderia cenocepacia TaxID=95486 RepID=UPI00264FC844|nr:integrase family protein [Burkholderia cenocepacia]MDN7537007.1 integrase family protein [Burkholderia cenocepacia]
MRFDARNVKTMQPGTDMLFGDFPGLRLRATAKRRSWMYRYKSPVDGRMRQIKLGSWPEMSYSAAIAAWEGARAQRDAGADAQLAKRKAVASAGADGPPTVKQVCRDYIAGHLEPNCTPRSAAQRGQLIMRMIKPIEGMAAADVTRAQAFGLISRYSSTPSSASRLRSELGAAWDRALDSDKLPADTPNWWRQILRGKLRSAGRMVDGKRSKTKRVLSRLELAELIPWLPNFAPTPHDILTLYLWTGLRGAELVAIEGREVTAEPDGLWWTIPKAKTKNRHVPDATDHRVPLVGRARDIVLARKAQYGDGLLFPGETEGKPIGQKTIGVAVWNRQPYSNAPSTAGLPPVPVTHWTPHDLRRTARTQLASLGCPREVGEAIVGHVVKGVEGVYNLYTYDAEKRVWLTQLSELLESLVR